MSSTDGGCSAINSCFVGPLPCTFGGATGDLALWVLADGHPRVLQPDSPIDSEWAEAGGGGLSGIHGFQAVAQGRDGQATQGAVAVGEGERD